MEGLKTATENLIDHAGDLLDSYYKLTVVNATDKATKAATSVMSIVVISLASVVILLMAGLGFAWWIGEAMDNMKAGFFIVAGVYVLLLMVFILLRRELVFPIIRKSIIQKVYE